MKKYLAIIISSLLLFSCATLLAQDPITRNSGKTNTPKQKKPSKPSIPKQTPKPSTPKPSPKPSTPKPTPKPSNPQSQKPSKPSTPKTPKPEQPVAPPTPSPKPLAEGERFTYEGIEYKATNAEKRQVELINGKEAQGNLTIPQTVTVKGISHSVISIGDKAFYDCSGLTSVTIPNSVTSIEEGAFSSCKSLTSITIPNSVTSIGNNAFKDCKNLTKVEISDIKSWCKIKFGSGDSNPLYYAHHLYLNGSEVKDLVIPTSVTSIGESAFSHCSCLTSVTIPNSITSIGKYAFEDCKNLTRIEISDIEHWCKIKFGNYSSNPLNYAHHLYLNGKEVKNLVIPNSVISIGDRVFSGCSCLTSVTIPNSVTSIGNYAFADCIGLKSVTIPSGFKKRKEDIFISCDKLKKIKYTD